jgi:hypothetical protein
MLSPEEDVEVQALKKQGWTMSERRRLQPSTRRRDRRNADLGPKEHSQPTADRFARARSAPGFEIAARERHLPARAHPVLRRDVSAMLKRRVASQAAGPVVYICLREPTRWPSVLRPHWHYCTAGWAPWWKCLRLDSVVRVVTPILLSPEALSFQPAPITSTEPG